MFRRSTVNIVVLLLGTIVVTASCSRFRKAPTPVEPSPSPSVAPAPSPQSTGRLPAPTGFVNDYANVIDNESELRLVDLVTKLRVVSNIEFAVVTIDTTKGEPIADYSLGVAKEWGVGPKNSADGGGLVLVLAIKDRQWHLQVSRSLEKDLPPAIAKNLAAGSTPLYKQGNYSAGIEKYVNAIIARLGKQRNFVIK